MNKTTETIVKQFAEALAQIEAALAPNKYCTVIAAENWIVKNEHFALTFSVKPEGDKSRATCTGQGHAHTVNRFSEESARKIAKAVDGEAVFWRDAAKEEAAQLRQNIEFLTQAA